MGHNMVDSLGIFGLSIIGIALILIAIFFYELRRFLRHIRHTQEPCKTVRKEGMALSPGGITYLDERGEMYHYEYD